MSFPNGTYLGEMVGVIREEFEYLYSQLYGYLIHQHAHDGGHLNVTAQSLILTASDAHGATGSVTADGDGTFDGAGSFGGNVTAHADAPSGAAPVVIGISPNSKLGLTSIGWKGGSFNGWSMGNGQGVNGGAATLAFSDDGQGPGVAAYFGFHRFSVPDALPAEYSLQPLGSPGITELYIGQNVLGRRVREVNAAGVIRERARNTPMGEWAAYTPTWTGITLGNASVVGRFSRHGKTVSFRIFLGIGSTTVVTGQIGASTPTAHEAAATAMSVGVITMFDSSAGLVYAGRTLIAGSPAFNCFTNDNPMTAVNSTTPFTWATSDQMWIMGTYEEV